MFHFQCWNNVGCLEKFEESLIQCSLWLQNVLILNSWPHCMKGGKDFRALGMKEGGEKVADVTRIKTKFKGDSTVS